MAKLTICECKRVIPFQIVPNKIFIGSLQLHASTNEEDTVTVSIAISDSEGHQLTYDVPREHFCRAGEVFDLFTALGPTRIVLRKYTSNPLTRELMDETFRLHAKLPKWPIRSEAPHGSREILLEMLGGMRYMELPYERNPELLGISTVHLLETLLRNCIDERHPDADAYVKIEEKPKGRLARLKSGIKRKFFPSRPKKKNAT